MQLLFHKPRGAPVILLIREGFNQCGSLSMVLYRINLEHIVEDIRDSVFLNIAPSITCCDHCCELLFPECISSRATIIHSCWWCYNCYKLHARVSLFIHGFLDTGFTLFYRTIFNVLFIIIKSSSSI